MASIIVQAERPIKGRPRFRAVQREVSVMADPTGEEQSLAAELDELLNQSRGRSATKQPAPEVNGESPPSIEQEIDQALDDAQGKINRIASGPDTEPGKIDPATIEELDEHLADSTPEDLDIRAEQELAQAREALSESRAHAAAQEITPAPPAPTQVPVEVAESAPESPAPERELAPEAAPEAALESETEAETEAETDEACESDATNASEDIIVGSPADESEASAPPHAAAPAKAALALLRTISAPLVLLSPNSRDIVGWMALVTAFNALCLWAYLLFVK